MGQISSACYDVFSLEIWELPPPLICETATVLILSYCLPSLCQDANLVNSLH